MARDEQEVKRRLAEYDREYAEDRGRTQREQEAATGPKRRYFPITANGQALVVAADEGESDEDAARRVVLGEASPIGRFDSLEAAQQFALQRDPQGMVRNAVQPEANALVSRGYLPGDQPKGEVRLVEAPKKFLPGDEPPTGLPMQRPVTSFEDRLPGGPVPRTPEEVRAEAERLEKRRESAVDVDDADPFRIALRPLLNLPGNYKRITDEAWEDMTGEGREGWERALGGLRFLFSPGEAVGKMFGESVEQPVRKLGASKEVSDYVRESASIVGEAATGLNVYRKGLMIALGEVGRTLGASKFSSLSRLGHELDQLAPLLPVGEAGKAIAAAKLIEASAQNMVPVPPRMAAKAIDSLLPRDWRFGNIWGNITEVISIPTRLRVFPGGREGKKSLAEILQPAVERLYARGEGLDKPFRLARAKKQLTMDAGTKLGAEIAELKPGERIDALRGLLGYGTRTEAAKQVVSNFNRRVGEFDLGSRYKSVFFDQLKKRVGKLNVPDMEDPIAKLRVEKFFDMVDQGMQGKKSVRKIQKGIEKMLSDPSVPEEMKQILVGVYNLPADTPKAVAKASTKASRAYMLSGLQAKGAISSQPQKGWQAVTSMSHDSFRPLWGKYVPRDVWLELKVWQDLSRISHMVSNKYFMSPWKTSKIILSPAANVRNDIGNLILNDWGGLPVYRGDVYLKALDQMKSRSRDWKQFRNMTGSGGTFSAHDVAQLGDGMRLNAPWNERLLTAFDRAVQRPRSYYNAQEQFFKFAKYLHNKGKHMDNYDAALDAMKWTFNYGEVTRFTGRMRATVAPFFTWQSKILPLMAEVAMHHPVRLGKYFAFYQLLQQTNADRLGIGSDEWEYMQNILPDYIADSQFLLVPFRDDKQRLQLLNLTYMIPGFGDLHQINEDPWGGLLGSPLLSIGGALRSKTKFGGAPLYYDWEDNGTKWAKGSAYVWQQIAPPWMPGGTDNLWSKIYQNVTDHPEAPSWYQIMGQEMGFKIQAVDEARAARRKYAVQDMQLSQLETDFLKQMDAGVKDKKSSEQLEDIAIKFALLRRELIMPKERGGMTQRVMDMLGR